jgi:hypothetical protein
MKPRYRQNYKKKTTNVSLLENHLTDVRFRPFKLINSRTLLTMVFIIRESVFAGMALSSSTERLGLPDVFQTLYSLGNPTDKNQRATGPVIGLAN